MLPCADLKQSITDREGVPASQIRLVHQGRQLQDHALLADYSINGQSTVHMVLRLRGGADGGGEEPQQASAGRLPSPHIALVSAQRVDGSWSAGEEVFKLLDVRREEALAAVPALLVQQQQQREELWATALVLAALHARCGGYRAEWSAAGAKARRWLAALAGQAQVKTLVEAAGAWLAERWRSPQVHP